jgi:hypothetical protein
MDDTTSLRLPGSQKIVYMGHRRWLLDNDPWRQEKRKFDNTIETRSRPRKRSGEEIHKLLNSWAECPKAGKKQKQVKPLEGVWKTKSVFWDLEYWPYLDTRHCIDVMHVEKNVCESLLGLLLHLTDKTKDGPKARTDLEKLGI